ncbi:MAG: hypothetical protein IKB70_02195 [Bacilli bacterium]|nr:hypothetical protein [Bacilli bacterium]
MQLASSLILHLINHDSSLPIVDELIADLYVLDDITRKDLFEYIKVLKKNHTDPKRLADLKDITIK